MAYCHFCGTACDCFEVISGSQHYFSDRIDCAVQRLGTQGAHTVDGLVESQRPLLDDAGPQSPANRSWKLNARSHGVLQ